MSVFDDLPTPADMTPRDRDLVIDGALAGWAEFVLLEAGMEGL